MLVDVVFGGVGSRAGLKVGDTIIAFNGAPVQGMQDLLYQLDRLEPRAQVAATVWRDSRPVPV